MRHDFTCSVADWCISEPCGRELRLRSSIEKRIRDEAFLLEAAEFDREAHQMTAFLFEVAQFVREGAITVDRSFSG